MLVGVEKGQDILKECECAIMGLELKGGNDDLPFYGIF